MAFRSLEDFAFVLASPPSASKEARQQALARQAILTKPAGSLGRLEEIAVFLAGWAGDSRPRINHARAAVFAGNHGITAHGVSAYPPEVTVEMVLNFERGGAAINALAEVAGLELIVVPLLLDHPTADFTTGPAMTEVELLDALIAGAAVVEPGLDLLVVGEMGIGNTTTAAAVAALSLGGPGAEWTGPGTGVDGASIVRKVQVVDAALRYHAGHRDDPFEILRRVGGRELAAIAGAVIAARAARVPVVLDGFITCASLAPLFAHCPAILDHCIAGHVSAEPGHLKLLDRFGLEPLLQLGMRLGEGSGGAVAVNILRSAVAAHNGMATFAEAGVSGPA